MSSAAAKRKVYLAKLKEEDPEFYETITGADDLDLGCSEEEEGDDDEDDIVEDGDGSHHEEDASSEEDDDDDADSLRESDIDEMYSDGEDAPAAKKKLKKIQDDQDASDSEDQGEAQEDDKPARDNKHEIGPDLVKRWATQLEEDKDPKETFVRVSRAVLAVVDMLNNVSKKSCSSYYFIKSPYVCDEVIRLSMHSMTSALSRMLNIDTLAQITASKKFRKYSKSIKIFLQNILKLFEVMTNKQLREGILRECVLPLLPCLKMRPQQCKRLVQKLVLVWATGHKSIRVLATLGLFKIIKMMNEEMHDVVLKLMYINYVKNCQFTSATTVDCINFMRVSLAELYSMDHYIAYRHMFIFVRQQATILRNAIIANKAEKFQQVYNWQFVHSLHLWCTVVCLCHASPEMQPMIHPLVEVALGTFQLQVNSARYWPLVLHVCDMLGELSAATGIYVPVLIHLVQVYCNINAVKCKKESDKQKEKEQEQKALNWKCILKLSNNELTSRPTLQKLLNEAAQHLVRYLVTQAHKIAFPDLVTVAVTQLKKSKDALCPGMTQQLYKNIQTQANYISDKRSDVTFIPKDAEEINEWESSMKAGPAMPLSQYYDRISTAGSAPWWLSQHKRKIDGQGQKQVKKLKRTHTTEVKRQQFSPACINNANEEVSALSLQDLQ